MPMVQKAGSYSISINSNINAQYWGHVSGWRLEGSNDGTNWNILDTRSGIVWEKGNGVTDTKYYDVVVENQKNYYYYRLNEITRVTQYIHLRLELFSAPSNNVKLPDLPLNAAGQYAYIRGL